jgi:hypothetical protein
MRRDQAMTTIEGGGNFPVVARYPNRRSSHVRRHGLKLSWWARWDSNPGPRDSLCPDVSIRSGLSHHPRDRSIAGGRGRLEPVIKGTAALR